MVVLLLVAVATGLVTLSLRDASQNRLEEEGARLSALFESARAQSRIVGTDVHWEPLPDGGSGFEFVGLPPAAAAQLPVRWLDPDTRAEILGAPLVVLGPEPLLPPQRVVLRLGEHRLAVGSDGLGPFQVIVPGADDAAAAR
jgi:general secretion pathway protein H